ncbi:hypothetical protein KIPB_004914 [Kipferlia bialata]|uniref:GDP-Man:Man(3)GlcNAc(2)-PP-Dol alpha-1,2-mannosyltransferase n=1 Tax=Kipferlia bialata TaxID=797122 RepID=A0A9K3CXN5_9EUKA|nr:hypothetical protein KIPB_004914 [Kipferlia bialata]|eukprot:g4914.t1
MVIMTEDTSYTGLLQALYEMPDLIGLALCGVQVCVLLVVQPLLWVLVVLLRFLLSPFRSLHSDTLVVLHPWAAEAGGGERVMWQAVRAFQQHHRRGQAGIEPEAEREGGGEGEGMIPSHSSAPIHILLDAASPSLSPRQLCDNALVAFGIEVEPSFSTGTLHMAEHTRGGHKYFSSLLQLLYGSLIALQIAAWPPGAAILDTAGIPGSYPLLKLGGFTPIPYVHFPILPSPHAASLLGRVAGVYDWLVARRYRQCGRAALCPMANSTWTARHLKRIWKTKSPTVLYPPCPSESLTEGGTSPRPKGSVVMVGHLRPDKRHQTAIAAFAAAYPSLADHAERAGDPAPTLTLIAPLRSEAERDRLEYLTSLIDELGVTDRVVWQLNSTSEELRSVLLSSDIALHCMEDEHFGIVCVEYLAAGCMCVCNNSGGPRDDILHTPEGAEPVGSLCTTVEEYTEAMVRLAGLEEGEREALCVRGRERAMQFGEAAFEGGIVAALTGSEEVSKRLRD